MAWIREGEVFPAARAGEPDAVRALRPWVVEEEGGSLRMWYSGHDGTSWRILSAVRSPGSSWIRRGVAIDVGFAGDTDDFGAESPSVVRTPGGYLMAYAGSDGEVSRLHMAASTDGESWEPLGTFLQREEEDRVGASHPCLLSTAERWWLFYSGYDGSDEGRRARVLGAVSPNGAAWDRLGPVLEPLQGEVAVGHPCAIEHARRLHLFFASEDGTAASVALATSADGAVWERRGPVLLPSGEGPDGLSVHAPCAVRLRDGSLHLWYSALPVGDRELAYRICEARFEGPWAA